MPEESAKAAAEWAVNKLIKNVGEAKTLVIRLASVKHQEQLRAFPRIMTACMIRIGT